MKPRTQNTLKSTAHFAESSTAELIPTTTSPSYTTRETRLSGSFFPEFLRLPRAGTRDPFWGLSRSTWNSLILPCEFNSFRAPIKSVSLRRPGTIRGARLIVFQSALDYFRKLEADQNPPAESEKPRAVEKPFDGESVESDTNPIRPGKCSLGKPKSPA